MSAKDKKSEVFSYFKKAKGDFLANARSHAISSNKGLCKHILAFVLMQMCAR